MKNLLCIFFPTIGLLLFLTGSIAARQINATGADTTLIPGKTLFQKNCSGCHGDKGQGYAGPNLTDKYWIHGGGTKNITATVNEGVEGKGMITWKGILSPEEISAVTKYVRSLQGTNPWKAKAPEGDLYKE